VIIDSLLLVSPPLTCLATVSATRDTALSVFVC